MTEFMQIWISPSQKSRYEQWGARLCVCVCVCVCVCMWLFTLRILCVNVAVFPYGWSVWRYFVFISSSDISIFFFFLKELNKSVLSFLLQTYSQFHFNNNFLSAFFVCIVKAFRVCVIVWNCVPHINTCMTSFPCLPRKGFSFPAWLNTHNEAVQVNQQQAETHQSLTHMSVADQTIDIQTHTRVHIHAWTSITQKECENFQNL